jgi:glucose-1-phosphate thymidylyltransferase
MKAIILAAGQGTRLRPVTLTMPKPLVPVANKWLINYAIDVLKAGDQTEIGIIVNSMDSPIVSVLGDGKDQGVAISYIIQEEQLGLAHAIGLARAFVGDEPFSVFLGDNIFQDKMQDLLVNFAQSSAEATVVLGEVPDPTRFGIAEIEGERIQRVVEKPKDPPSNLAIAGVYLFRPSIFQAIDQIKPSWRNEYEITDAIQVLISQGKRVAPYALKGWWIDAGKPDAIVLANQLVLEELPYSQPPANGNKIIGECDVSHRVLIGENSQIINSVVRGPVIIGDNTTVKDSYVGPYTSLGNNVTVEGSELEASIIMDNCVIHAIPGRIDRSLLAYNARVTSTQNMPTAHRFVLAENTYVEL